MNAEVNLESGESLTVIRLRAARRTRLSFAVVAIILLSAAGCAFFKFAAARNPLALQAVILFGFLGVALLVMEPASRLRRANELRILRFHKSPRFYGTVTSVSCALVLMFAFITEPTPRAKAKTLPPAVEAPKVVAPDPAPEVKAEPPKAPEFPPMEVAGVILGGNRSSALINGKTVMLGEFFNDVKLVEVREDLIVVELRGFKKEIQFGGRKRAFDVEPTKSRK